MRQLASVQHDKLAREVVDIMMDFRTKRMMWMIANPQDAGEDGKTPKSLTREAEAAAIIAHVNS